MLINIQLLRFLAAMLVVLYHTSFRLPGGSESASGLFRFGQATGFAGVDVFFVISGFIMAYTTLEDSGAADSSRFVRRRLARIYSGYWPFFFLALAVYSWTRPAHVAESGMLASLLLWPQPLNLVLLELTWTLSFELYFYLLFGLLVMWIPQQRRLPLCLLIATGMLVLALYRNFVTQSFAPGNLHTMPFGEHFLISPFLVEFFAGAALAYWLRPRRGGSGLLWLVSGCALFGLAGWVNEVWFAGNIEQGYYVVPRVLWFGGAAILIVGGLVKLEHSGRQAARSFSIRTGGASYAIYLSHAPILGLATQMGLPGALRGSHPMLVMAAYIALMALIAVLSWLHYERLERPLHRLFRRYLKV